MANTAYSNFFLSNEIEDQYKSRLDLQKFFKVDNSLVGRAGMKRTIHVYAGTGNAQKLTQGNGNTQSIESGYTSKDYDITLAQSRFVWYDEEEMKDPEVVRTGVQYQGTDMFNTVNGDIYNELKKATRIVLTTYFDFDAFVNAQAMLEVENLDGVYNFAFVCPADVAEIRKKLATDLKYVEAFARQGYIGTVAGCHIFTKKDATSGSVYLATGDAITLFNKKGIEIEDERDGNTRKNTKYSCKYYLTALTDETKDVKICKGTATVCPSTETTVDSSKTYYAADGTGYVKVTPATGDNPYTKGWYTIA